MSIAKMKRLRMVAPKNARRRLLRDLTRLGCVEVERSNEWMTSPEWSGLLRKSEEEGTSGKAYSDVSSALGALQKYAGVKKGLLTPRKEVGEAAFYDPATLEDAKAKAAELNGYAKEIAALQSEEGRYEGQKAALAPWSSLDIPLDFKPRSGFTLVYGVCASVVDFEAMKKALADEVAESELWLVSSDKEQHYMLLVAHEKVAEKALENVKAAGFSAIVLKGEPGTVPENIALLDKKIAETAARREELTHKIESMKDCFDLLGQASDAFSLEAQRDDILASLGATQKTVYLEGWVPAKAEKEVAAVAEANGCAYEFDEPAEGEEPPVLLNNNGFVRPFGEITNLYGLPGYNSLVDPNPFVAVSYFIFFGLMFSDAIYGLILVVAGLYVLNKGKPTGALKNFMKLAFLVGISTFAWGAFFGSWCGDIAEVVAGRLGFTWAPPAVMDPLVDPIAMLIMSLTFGVVHLFVGLGISIYRKFKRGEIVSAICDDMVWYFVVVGAVLTLVGMSWGLWMAVAGLVVVLFTAGRDSKGLGKITGGLGALYSNTTGYLSDILSYSRLMALSMATGVVASVINTLGNMFGNSIFGWILLVVIFLIGQVFNFAISILGAFVHSCRLEYVEFFGKFYEGGGRAFKPLFNKTKYTEVIIKEEN